MFEDSKCSHQFGPENLISTHDDSVKNNILLTSRGLTVQLDTWTQQI